MKNATFYIESFGCQMNVYDSEVIASILLENGYGAVSSPEDADVILVNTCSVREHAENRAIGRLTDLSRYRDAILAVCGCMAQRMGERLFKLVPGVHVVSGTDSYERLPAVVGQVLETGGRYTLLERDDCITYSLRPTTSHCSATRYLSITRGCENYCSYCIVPFLRGSVRSKDPATILREVSSMGAGGAKEITLLGQNVMAYRAGKINFPDLIENIINVTDIPRLRFLTSHPRDIRFEIFDLMAREKRVCPHIHLPLQSGSDRILQLMNRGYTGRQYLDIVRRARETVPDLAITTDIIVGFPSETESDYHETVDLVEKVRFDAAFTFKYSPREGTAAASMDDDVPAAVKKERLHDLNETIGEIRREVLRGQLGSETEIVLDGSVQKREYHFWKGRSPHFRNVLISSNHVREGDIVRVRLRELRNFTFIGEELARR